MLSTGSATRTATEVETAAAHVVDQYSKAVGQQVLALADAGLDC